MAQFHGEMLQKISELEESYISTTDLADRRSNKQLLEEYDFMSAELSEMSKHTDYEERYALHTPYLRTGSN